MHQFECSDAPQFDGPTCEVELPFAACTRETFMVFSPYPNLKLCALSVPVCMSRAKSTFISSHLYSTPNNGILINARIT
ncbi:hypothetical protein PISMIDRAFT_689404 [Pisolithus microcarpus 441]|uniref:Uncharacterized protein n=1 Tax=Pisolithus microcarpus 441 TaxID=765257 RepID=A0A0C9YF60_9AGAM|nr:hypothetical protein PISMIDRAFT_689404 [Pisolithus microcarpus 441]